MTIQALASNLVLRAYRGPEDHPAMAATAAAVRADNGDRELGTVADIDNHYAHLDQAALPRDCALVEVDGLVVAYGRASWAELADGSAQVESILNIRPDARGRGVEELLADHAIRRARELNADPAVTGGRQANLVVFVSGRDEVQRSVLEGLGFQVAGHFAGLIRPNFESIPDLPLPDGLEVRPIDPADRTMHRRVYDASVRAFADSRGEEKPSDAKFDEFVNDPSFAPHLWQVAFDGDRIAGQILNYLGDAEEDGTRIGWTEGISVQPEHRRRGLARALLARSLRVVRDAGATCAGLGVDLQNPNQAVELYRSMGYRIVSETFEYALGPASLDEDRSVIR
ncbi:MAG TPA: GNAT family N-acetyltransferase [Candidatus Limnocylindrales bacterium]|nr:GNAT family N-acetyltransferase [Candidatus Limnocylindrales bacterium]